MNKLEGGKERDSLVNQTTPPTIIHPALQREWSGSLDWEGGGQERDRERSIIIST